MGFIVWEGVFETFQDAKARHAEKTGVDVFRARRWLDNTLSQTKQALRQGAAPTGAATHDDLLPVLASQVAKANGCVRILDFGGGMGAGVPKVFASLPSGAAAEITIIDNAESCTAGRTLFGAQPGVIFTESFPPQNQLFDIVHCGSSLHYADDWRHALKTLAGYEADHLLFSEVPAGEIPTFVSLQVYYEHLIPMRFWNIGEFVGALEKLGYTFISQTALIPTIRGVTGPLPMANFPEDHRLEYYCHLFFSPARRFGT